MSEQVEAEAMCVGHKVLEWVVLSCYMLGGALDSKDSLDPGPAWVT
jgi:hypothetical protein